MVTLKYQIWLNAQKREKSYYQGRAQGLSINKHIPYVKIHETFWKDILKLLPELLFCSEGHYYDIGCGPNSILAFVEHGKRVGIDPLMNFYKKNFNLPPDIEFSEGKIETLNTIQNYEGDIIFVMNCIDHGEEVELASQTLAQKIKPKGYLVISVNIVQNKLIHFLSNILNIYKYLDPTHPHHYSSPCQLIKIFQHSFDLVKVQNIQNLAIKLANEKNKWNKAPLVSESLKNLLKKLIKKMLIIDLREDLHLILLRKKNLKP